MKTKMIGMVVGLLLSVGGNLYAANGDLIVNGALGIGTNSPQGKLDVRSNSGEYTFITDVWWQGQLSPRCACDTHISSRDCPATISTTDALGTTCYDIWRDYTYFELVSSKYTVKPKIGIYVSPDGSLGIGTAPSYKLDVAGQARINGTVYTSDIQYKKNIDPVTDALDRVVKLRGVSYEWKRDEYQEKNFPDGRHYGVIAQEVEKILPDVVSAGSDGTKAVAYIEIIPVLIEAIKEQQKEIAELKKILGSKK